MVIGAVNKITFAAIAAAKQVESYSAIGYSDEIKQQCLLMYVNGNGFRTIKRLTGVNHNTVINWVRLAAASLPDAPEYLEIPEIARF